MPQIVVSNKVKTELEDVRKEGEFKSLDAAIRYLLNASVTIKDVTIIHPERGVKWIDVKGRVKVDTTKCTIKVLKNQRDLLIEADSGEDVRVVGVECEEKK